MNDFLSSLTVVEIGTAVSVPLVGRFFADAGATVIKVESSHRPDANRARVPPRSAGAESQPPGEKKKSKDPRTAEEDFPLWHEVNAGKKSITLNLKTDKGRELLVELLRRSDVLIENYAPGWLNRIGLSFDQFFSVNERLVILAASAYGEHGPLNGQRGYAPIMSALAGMEGLIGYENEEPVGAMASALSDLISAYYGILGVMSALETRRREGRGCVVDLSQIEASCATGFGAYVGAQAGMGISIPMGNRHPDVSPHGMYRCKGLDEWVAIAAETDRQWSALVEVLGLDALAKAGVATAVDRRENEKMISHAIESATQSWERDELVERLQQAGIPCAPLLRVDEVESSPRFRRRGLTQSVTRSDGVAIDVTSIPWQINGKGPMQVRAAGPLLGQDTETVLRERLGLSEGDIAAARISGALE